MSAKRPFFRQVHKATARLNRGLEHALASLSRLERLGLLREKREFVKICSLTLGEMRGWANYEIGEAISQRAEKDWIRFGRLRLRREKKLRDPNDVLIEAERLKRKGVA